MSEKCFSLAFFVIESVHWPWSHLSNYVMSNSICNVLRISVCRKFCFLVK